MSTTMNVIDKRHALWGDRTEVLVAAPKRCEQFSVKVTEDACRRFRRLAEAQGVTLGALFEHALDALERECGRGAGVRPAEGMRPTRVACSSGALRKMGRASGRE